MRARTRPWGPLGGRIPAAEAGAAGCLRPTMAPMKIAPGHVVTLAYDLCTETGEIIENSDLSGPVSFIHGKGAMLPGLDRRIEGMGEGEDGTFDIPPEEGFGRIEDAPTRKIPRREFPASAALTVGLSFAADLPGGQTIQLQIVEIGEEEVTVRMIHPLAGKPLKMTVRVLAVREATAKETESGKVVTRPPPPKR